MKTKDIKSNNTYTAYVIDDQSRNHLLTQFSPKYSTVIGHHITVSFGVNSNQLPSESAFLKVIGYVDSGDGLEALVVAVNDNYTRPDGNMYHITWSLDSNIYKPKDSNTLLKSKKFTLIRSIPIKGTPAVLE